MNFSYYDEENEKCIEYSKKLPKNIWKNINPKNINIGDTISVYYCPDSQKYLDEYTPQIGVVREIVKNDEKIIKIIILNHNDDDVNIIKNDVLHIMKIKILTDIPEDNKSDNKRKIDVENVINKKINQEIDDYKISSDSDDYKLSESE